MSDAPSAHWTGGRLGDEQPSPVTPWQQIASVLVLLWLFDFLLGMRSAAVDPGEHDDATQLRRTLAQARAEAEAGHRSILLISLIRDHDGLLEPMRRELDRESDARLAQIGFAGLLPVDALRLVTELDRLDPDGEVELLVELDLRVFAPEHAEQRDCTLPAVCELGEASLNSKPAVQASRGVSAAAGRVADLLLEWTPVHRHRGQVGARSLDQLPGLAVPKHQLGELETAEAGDDEARAREHYRSASIELEHAQVEALLALLDRAVAHDRKVTLFLTPLADSFARRSFEEGELGQRYAALARLVNDYEDPKLALIDLDHPLFVDAHFLDHVQLGVEGSRLLALNLLHELNLPLASR
ncbi:MAG TPA: hypothetical protein VK034_18455, partial [Enhygromyxa sp.]|nr:hypothetical protein [Enhygromyxa sp.]